ncbi:hypothetical protein Leryth_022683 [Lithospermum erythrorhizon]|nr:hypothetical protein Leryth_022683 [Lithospermum erythrorhizon]
MAATLYLLFLVIISAIIPSSCQAGSPRNIEVVYPFPLPPILPPPFPLDDEQPAPPPGPSILLQPPPDPPTPSSKSSKRAVGTAIGVTAASTLVLSALFFFLLRRYSRRKKEQTVVPQAASPPPAAFSPDAFTRFDGNLKGVIVDESGLDVLYWRKLDNQNAKESFKKQIIKYVKNEPKEEEKQVISSRPDGGKRSGLPIQEVPFLVGEASSSQSPTEEKRDLKAVGKSTSAIPSANNAQLPTAFTIPPVLPLPPSTKGKSPATPPPPPPPPIQTRKGPAAPPPPPPPRPGGLASTSKPIPAPTGLKHGGEQESDSEGGSGQVKLKPLHWDKVNANTNHSMVWNKLESGSFRVDDDLMEALFGYVATNKKSPKSESSSKVKGNKYSPPAQVFILDTRKSQNIAIVLRSLAISRKEIIYALTDGHGLDTDTLEKLNRIAPTKEEESDILAFDGDYTKLADAESFIYHLLKAVPSAFMRFNAMLFKSNYDSEVSQFKESLQILESACKELRTRGIFLKLLEAILKAGNRMNAGTSRGNAQAFNLTSLKKLSDVKSTDGKTTLLHFVVEEVVRAEGKRNVLNRNNSLSWSSSSSSKGTQSLEKSLSRDEREKEYTQLGLPVVGGLSSEFSNVKKSASMDYDSIAKTCSILTTRAAEIKTLVAQCGDDGGGFARVMKSFLHGAEHELKITKDEQTRVMEVVRRTTAYFHTGASKDKDANPLQLFVIVNDFLLMVDQACLEIARNNQRKISTSSVGSSSKSQSKRTMKFPILPANFLSEYPRSSSSDSDDDSHVKPRD